MARLTDSEWKVMEALWQGGPQTLGEALARLEEDTGWSRTTVHTLSGPDDGQGPGDRRRPKPPAVLRRPLPGELCGGGGGAPWPTGPTAARRGGWWPPSCAPGSWTGRRGRSFAACWTRWRCSRWKISGCSFSRRRRAGCAPSFSLLLQRIFRNLLSPVAVRDLGVLVLRLMIPVGARGRSTVLDVWPWLEAARAGAELALDSACSSPLDALPSPGPAPHPPGGAPRSLTDWLFLPLPGRGAGPGPVVPGVRPAPIPSGSPGASRWRAPAGGHRRCGPTVPAAPPPAGGGVPLGAKSLPDGIFAPALVLPMGWEPDEAVILHKLLHLKHRDLWAGWLTAALPLSPTGAIPFCGWPLTRRTTTGRPCATSACWSVWRGEDRRDYGRVLLSMADSRAVRVPGATTMANGARAIQARIQAIARFKRFPGEWPWCPAVWGRRWSWPWLWEAPLRAERPIRSRYPPGLQRPRHPGHSGAQPGRHRGRGAGLLWQGHAPPPPPARPGPSVPGMTVPEEDLPQVLEQYREALRLSEEHPEQLLRWWRSGPVFRGLVSDGGGGFLCQVFWFRDQEMQVGDVYPREDGAPGRWSTCAIRCISCPTGRTGRWRSWRRRKVFWRTTFMIWIFHSAVRSPGVVEADGLRLEISAAQILGDRGRLPGPRAAPHPP